VSLYVDTSALLKRYIDESDSGLAEAHLLAHPVWLTGHHTWVEAQRNLARLLRGPALKRAVAEFKSDWQRMHIVLLDEVVIKLGAELAVLTGSKTLDALHLACRTRVGVEEGPLLTFDVRQAQAARRINIVVLGV
jgi:predicted nucleic acid-binding protein